MEELSSGVAWPRTQARISIVRIVRFSAICNTIRDVGDTSCPSVQYVRRETGSPQHGRQWFDKNLLGAISREGQAGRRGQMQSIARAGIRGRLTMHFCWVLRGATRVTESQIFRGTQKSPLYPHHGLQERRLPRAYAM